MTDTPRQLPAICATEIKVIRQGRDFALYIDGTKFPWATHNGAQLHVNRNALPSVTITIPADRVEVVDTMGTPGEPE